ncbi:MAG: class I SAM-dependent methyltransferase [Hymenobacteraceae bacterium]|nr:class I SAM-dependent methyltransferase [Hymenobacteraceae bacterium]
MKRWLLLNFRLDDSHIERQSDRKWFAANLLPRLENVRQGRVLFVGCAFYTYKYLKNFNKAVDLITVDYDAHNAMWGGHNHLVADIQQVDRLVEPASVDIVLLNGIFGHGVNTPEAQTRTYEALHNIMKPDGLLLVGWNHDLSQDPLELDACQELYYRTGYEGLPERTCFTDSTHVYDFLRAKQKSR